MKIKKLHISNFKSIRDLELINPNPFSVFVGPNGAGKSNIFEALEFAVLLSADSPRSVLSFYQNYSDVLHPIPNTFKFYCELDNIRPYCELKNYDLTNNKLVSDSIDVRDFLDMSKLDPRYKRAIDGQEYDQKPSYNQFFRRYSRLFLNRSEIKRQSRNDNIQLSLDGSNLEKVLERILGDENNREEIVEWLQILVPEFKDIRIETSSLEGKVSYVIYEKYSEKPFPKRLISDGTKNILALLAAVYQSDKPQFLCIEEPENGLHPYVIESLVNFFRSACGERGHYIWLNTHSQTLVRQLTMDEIIVVDKKEGTTRTRQFQRESMHGLKMDDAWLTNALGGGLP